MTDIHSVLIANRGEIARRIANALLDHNIIPVLPITEKEYPQAVGIFKDCRLVNAPDGIYLDPEKLVKLAETYQCGGIHPGYGFLAESAAFATLCEENNIVFIGPPASAIAAMGHKERAREIARKANVSPVPGFSIDGSSEADILKQADAVGFPVLVKASLGGGGKGMRRVATSSELMDAIRIARSESSTYFGSDAVFIEKYIENPRHIEVQVFSFAHGSTIYVGERECTIQRRHQKIIEESPSPVVDEALRQRMGEAAVRIADSVGYVGAGTVEFIADSDLNFYFLEMNTRIQVEHPVTEEVYGVDLVAWQIEEALGEAPEMRQQDLHPGGHAIEFRIYAEDPARNFMPCPGQILLYREPEGPGIRVESAVRTGSTIFSDFDPLIAKIIVKGHSRKHTIAKAKRALQNFAILGVTTNREYLMKILDHEAFVSGHLDTAFTDRYRDDLGLDDFVPDEKLATVAAWIRKSSRNRTAVQPASNGHEYYPEIASRIP